MIRQQSYQNNKATLYLIATPIGNLKEVTIRMQEILPKIEAVFCEDTRITGKLLNNLNIKKIFISCPDYTEKSNCEKLLSYLNNNQDVAYMSDAGYPCISDPGNILVNCAIENNYNVVVINGPSAMLTALLSSGLDTKHFYFYGFLDANDSKRKKELEKLKDFQDTIIFYQSPHKILKVLQDMLLIFGDRKICLAREMTKMYEEYIRGTISEIIPICETLKGEMVLVCNGNTNLKNKENISLDDACKLVDNLINNGLYTNDAIKKISSSYNIVKKELYNYYINKKNKDD